MKHTTPAWMNQAKVGLLFNWGVPSLGAVVPPGREDRADSTTRSGRRSGPAYYLNHPESAWYLNGLRLEGSAVRANHDRKLSPYYDYTRMTQRFFDRLDGWDASVWPALAREVGARYLIAVAKQPDGVLLWESTGSSLEPPRPVVPRDLVGEIAAATREHGLRFGVYYAGRLDFHRHSDPIRTLAEALSAGSNDAALATEVDAHYRELIDRYQPDILWNDTGVPRDLELSSLFARYRQVVPEGVVNDRWGTPGRLGNGAADRSPERADRAEHGIDSRTGDYATVAVDPFDPPSSYPAPPFEAVVPLGRCWSLGEDDDVPSGEQLIERVVDATSAGGNVLLVLSPDADGAPPATQLRSLLDLGAWLRSNGAAVYGTGAWHERGTTTAEGVRLRYTANAEALHIITCGHPRRLTLTIPSLDIKRIPGYAAARKAGNTLSVKLLGYGPVDSQWHGSSFELSVPGGAEPSNAFTFELRFGGPAASPNPTFDWFTDLI